jgi:hypothetical protein
MKISGKTRVADAGRSMADAIVATVHILYLNDNALEYLNALVKGLRAELARRIRGAGRGR